MKSEQILVGRFGAPHGVGGDVRLQSFTDIPKAIASYAPLTDATGVRLFAIKSLRLVKENVFVAKIAGIEDRTAAESLTNLELFFPRDRLPKTAKDEFYHADLVGLAAVAESGEPFGRVINVLNFGGGDILEIAPQGGGETLLLPFTKDVVPEIDLKGGRVVLAPPVEIGAKLASETEDGAASPLEEIVQRSSRRTRVSPDET